MDKIKAIDTKPILLSHKYGDDNIGNKSGPEYNNYIYYLFCSKPTKLILRIENISISEEGL